MVCCDRQKWQRNWWEMINQTNLYFIHNYTLHIVSIKCCNFIIVSHFTQTLWIIPLSSSSSPIQLPLFQQDGVYSTTTEEEEEKFVGLKLWKKILNLKLTLIKPVKLWENLMNSFKPFLRNKLTLQRLGVIHFSYLYKNCFVVLPVWMWMCIFRWINGFFFSFYMRE